LADQDVLSAQQLDETELEKRQAVESLAAAVAAVESAGHRLSQARAHLLNLGSPNRRGGEPISIRAPIDGLVLRTLRTSESVVAAGEPLLEVGDPSELEIVADYLSRDAVRIRPGAHVWIERWGGEGALKGRVRRVEPSGFTKISALGIEEKRVNVIIDLVSPRIERSALSDGFRVESRVVVLDCDDVLQVPVGSLFRQSENWAVFTVQSGRARVRRVTLGARTPVAVEVSDGLGETDWVITHPGNKVVEGVRVAPRKVPDGWSG